MQQTPQTPTTNAGARLAPLHRLDDFKVADGEPDIRGWSVHTADGRVAGKVDDLIVDTQAMKVRYIDVELDRGALGLREERHVLVPLAEARLDDRGDEVRLGSATAADLARMQPLDRERMEFTGPPPRDEDASRFYGDRGTGDVRRMTLSEEELRVGKRMAETGEVDVRKTVETRHVSKTVPVMHEEVDIERRPIEPGSQAQASARIAEDEIRVPLRAEEAVIEKRTVPKEEVIIRKQAVQGEQKVEADVRSERVDVDRSGKTKPPRK